MLTRPLAFKGPVDHLGQFFALATLYQGMQLLLQDSLMDWQYTADNESVSGVFVAEQKFLKCRLAWPLVSNEELSHCDCKASVKVVEADLPDQSTREPFCEHLAALAIESKMRLERLPQPLKPANPFVNELAYLSDWIGKQRFDPYPNMARHRVLYILEGELTEGSPVSLQLSVHKGYLTQQNEYQRKDELDLAIDERDKLPKFISLSDQQIILMINSLCREYPQVRLSTHSLTLEFPQSSDLLQKLVNTGRCFWRSCHRQPIGWQVEPQFAAGSWPLSEDLWFDKPNNRIGQLSPQLDGRALALVNLLAKTPDIPLTPCLRVTSDTLTVPWSNQLLQKPSTDGSSPEVDQALVEFQCGEVSFKLQEILRWWPSIAKHGYAVFLEQVAARIHQLDWLPSLAASFETPLVSNYDIADRYLNNNLSHWFVLFRALQCAGWRVDFDAHFRLNQQMVDDWYSTVISSHRGVQSNSDASAKWFELELGVLVNGRAVNILPLIVEALQRGNWQDSATSEYLAVTLEDGSRIRLARQRLQNIVANLLELWENRPLNRQQRLALPVNQFSRLAELEKQLNRNTDWQDLQWLRDKAQRLSRLTQFGAHRPAIEQIVPDNVAAKLRDYQREGVFWLQTLREEALAGILADDMGLGKTLQTLCHLQIEKNSGRLTAPSMVVAPTSLLGNWHAEAQRFTPGLKILRWSGSQREQQRDRLSDCDLIITSYGVLQRDAEMLNSLNLDWLVLDEAQTIKNSRSRIARLCYSMRARHRLCLTGTPLENHLGELWSLFHFLMPGFLGDEAQFKRLFQQPIEKEQDFQRQEALSLRVAPFMLRRTKAIVAADLPQKTVIDELVELSESQADIYEATRLSMLEEVQQVLLGKGRNSLLIGNALLRLRQICCHPMLLKAPTESHRASLADSAKLQWLLTVLPEMIEAEQKVLIFSSFTRMLDIIAHQLDKQAIPYLTLTGQSRHRSELVARFQAGEVPVFLISLKAGGAGLNLTRADTVIHYDPWWNPAAETQASDRAHRIGQDKPVFVYKLIGKGTIEERIQQMQEKKQQLADQLYQGQATTSLSETDWQALLAPLED